MKLNDILLMEDDKFGINKRESGYHQAFPYVSEMWTDTILSRLREDPYARNKSVEKFAHKVEEFFYNKFGSMVYYRGDESIINGVIDDISSSLDLDGSMTNIKKNIKNLSTALHQLIRRKIVAPEGAHQEETDFWMNQREKNDYMGNQ